MKWCMMSTEEFIKEINDERKAYENMEDPLHLLFRFIGAFMTVVVAILVLGGIISGILASFK